MARRKDGHVAILDLARHLAELIYRLLRFGQPYHDIGARAYEERFAVKRLAAITAQAQEFGYKLIPEPVSG